MPAQQQAVNVSGYIMRTLKFITTLLLIALYSCGQENVKRKVNPQVAILSNKIIPLVNFLDDSDSCKKALLILDSTTRIDNDCFLCHYNKLMFLYSLKQFGNAVETIKECIRIKPSAHDLYTTGGILYEKIGDTISSSKYFNKSLSILNPVLDTMKVQNINYEMLVSNKAINLIMLGDNKTGNDLLKSIADRQKETELKEYTLSFMNKSKKELVDMLTNSQYSR
jgi:tetratricopeptide (TPR) repeat protein